MAFILYLKIMAITIKQVPLSFHSLSSPRQYLLLCLMAGLLLLSSSITRANSDVEQDVSEQDLRILKTNIAKLGNWLSKANSEKSGLVRELAKQEKQINQLSRDIRSSKRAITNGQASLKALNIQLKQQQQTIRQQQAFLMEELRALYMQGSQPALKQLLDSNNPLELSRFIAYFSYLNDARSHSIDEFKEALTALEKTERDILKRQKSLNDQKRNLEAKHKTLNKQSALRQTTLNQLRNQITNKSLELSALKENQTRLEQLLREVERAVADFDLTIDNIPFQQQKAKLIWPSRGKVLEKFGVRVAQGKLKSNGIRIATKEDGFVKSVHDGRVIFSDWLRGFGLLLIIDHGDDYMSLYGNNKTLIKETGDWITGGEVIAHTRSSGSSKESGLYFEIRYKGKPKNPLKWLKR